MVEVVSLLLPAALLWLVVSIWVGIDAAKHSSHDAFVWGLSVFVGGLLGLLLYFNIGRNIHGDSREGATTPNSRTGLVTCSNCQSLEAPSRDSCRVCGDSLN
ncbi:hypothetical protein [Haloferax larsenii]|uniref:Phospholipase_D-nuclease N-terminal n=1 Tax=Haloferax larsenii TaxID=302484 RepID=A0A1H7L672_HALLR|nr:hypothetical protein [Haloferax larsenii]SEK94334.1 hypothetical protein SAMN04488691_102220 [Haloferax larsenii]